MKKIIEKTVWYQCSVCKTKYSKASEARECEAKILEEKKFKAGDLVTNIEPRTCWSSDKRPYVFKGEVIKIIGPLPSDEEYELKWLGGNPKRLDGHVWEYEIKYICPRCHEKTSHRYYTPELKKLEMRKIR